MLLTDAAGRVVRRLEPGTVATGDLPPGVYFIVLHDTAGTSRTRITLTP
jgi:hypothetical protein